MTPEFICFVVDDESQISGIMETALASFEKQLSGDT